ncbi:MAG: MvaI/BcnI family restriction endonuclease [Candidatus Micrarchaeota archaeon]|nr:MvaI/BcnI family restriction endonuclease [Candidatus Micrarchaeota archaeon]
MVKNKANAAQNFTKEEFIQALKDIKAQGWILNHRPGNDGGAGNTIEDLLGIEENNLPIADTKNWELKTQKVKENYITLFHMDPYPREANLVPSVLLPKYGWKHKEAGKKYPSSEMSFRATLCATRCTDRGFIVEVDRQKQLVLVSFDSTEVGPNHAEWLKGLTASVGKGEFAIQPIWGFEVLKKKVYAKIKNTFFVKVKRRKNAKGEEEFLIDEVWMLEDVSFDLFIDGIEKDFILIDFDARTGHNHGTKFRTADTDSFKKLYRKATMVI